MSDPKERRAHPRSPCEIPVLILSDEFAWKGTILDYSEGGAFVTSTLQPGVGSTLGFQFQRPSDAVEVEIQGVVRRTSDKAGSSGQEGFGVQFDGLLSGASQKD